MRIERLYNHFNRLLPKTGKKKAVPDKTPMCLYQEPHFCVFPARPVCGRGENTTIFLLLHGNELDVVLEGGAVHGSLDDLLAQRIKIG